MYGFLAYKGTLQTGRFNVMQLVSPEDISTIQNHFVAWWSPGQWMVPGLLHSLLGCRLGVASIIITVLFSLIGLYGFYRLYRYFEFSIPITITALLIIVLSDAFYTSYIIYQGGEILSFGVFPWFLLFVVKLNKTGWKEMLLFGVFFLICFTAKITLVLYCSLVVCYKIFEEVILSFLYVCRFKKYVSPAIWLSIPWLVTCAGIYFFYFQKGPRPTLIRYFSPQLSDILIPLSSPLSSLMSAQTMIVRAQKIITGGTSHQYVSLTLYFILCIVTVISIYLILKHAQISKKYVSILIVLYAGVSLFFMAGYLFDTNIDKNVRHFKLLGFMFLPVFLSLIQHLKMLRVLTFLFVFYSVSDFIYLKIKWSENRYLSANYFYRNYYDPDNIDKIGAQTYKKLIALDQSAPLQFGKQPVIFFYEGNPDIAIDIKHPGVFETDKLKLSSSKYFGNKATVFIVVTKRTFFSAPDFLRQLLPDYRDFEKIDETNDCLFFKSK
jgi:hypothetical protein